MVKAVVFLLKIFIADKILLLILRSSQGFQVYFFLLMK